MKKVLKSSILFLLISVLLVGLTACGKEDESSKKASENSNKLVATKQVEDGTTDPYTEKMEITFKDNKATEIKIISIFETEDTAKEMYDFFNLFTNMAEDGEDSMPEGLDFKLDGKQFIITMDAKAFMEEEGVSEEEITKEAIQKMLEDEGYTIEQ